MKIGDLIVARIDGIEPREFADGIFAGLTRQSIKKKEPGGRLRVLVRTENGYIRAVICRHAGARLCAEYTFLDNSEKSRAMRGFIDLARASLNLRYTDCMCVRVAGS